MNLRADYKKNGYLHLKGFFKPERIQLILDETKQVFVSQMKRVGICTKFDHRDEALFREAMAGLFELDLEAFINCGKQVQHSINLHRLSLAKEIEVLLQSLGLKKPNISTRPVLFFNHPSLAKEKVYHTVFPHQDWRSMQGSLDAIVIWCPLINIDASLGALKIVPGSHKKGLLTDSMDAGFGRVSESDFDSDDWHTAEVLQGDLLLFSSFLVHGSGEIEVDRIRWSCHFRYNNLDEPTFVHRKYHHNYLYRPIDDLHTPDFPTLADIDSIFVPEE